VKRFGAAKRRLAAGMDDARREALVAAMLDDVLAAIGAARSIEHTIVVSSEPRATERAAAAGAEAIEDPGETASRHSRGETSDAAQSRAGSHGHSDAALAGIARAEERGATCVVLLPGDCPLLDPRELDRLLTGVPASYVGVVPDRHGLGTNALVLSPPGAIRPSFGEGSRRRHVAAAREAGIPFGVEELASLALDLDTPADLIALTRELTAQRQRARRTAKVLGL
jgi:2-phospho-L-lactate guanylyltransferase